MEERYAHKYHGADVRWSMLSVPIFKAMLKYAWYASKLINEREVFMNVKDICFAAEVRKNNGCKMGSAFGTGRNETAHVPRTSHPSICDEQVELVRDLLAVDHHWTVRDYPLRLDSVIKLCGAS
ncbi:hypothetical protein ANN_05515 [Periplaneta americana]|uniref:Uncharacterized protein n=1 Tax=Periplaneta americana TaxID=6978 RepID=A0ABQ8TCX9_PERAM|nr:hypothetical protein ANN_05515 [Periplaneta americana]